MSVYKVIYTVFSDSFTFIVKDDRNNVLKQAVVVAGILEALCILWVDKCQVCFKPYIC